MDDKESVDEDELLDQTIKERFQREVVCIEGLSQMLYGKYGRYITVSGRKLSCITFEKLYC